ncbi:MAG TPA: helix-turn-helix domain-containing protein [Cellvibrio sp.]|nr:helix-turn-helix domain-containing protein [Cellvibrio sp.]
MQEFYNKALVGLAGLLLASCLLGYFCVDNTFLRLSLLPANKSTLSWYAEPHTDVYQGGNSTLTIVDDKFSLDANFVLSRQAQYPFAAITMVFGPERGKIELVDLSAYDKIVFSAKCSQPNSLSFSLMSFDEQVSKVDNFVSYRAPVTFFSCAQQWSQVELDLTRMEIPQWWFDMFKVELSHKEYSLDKVAKFSFGSSFQSVFDIETNIQLNEITLVGRNWAYLYLLAAFMMLAWGSYAFWFFRQHTRALTRELHDKIQRDRPLVAYQQVSVEPLRDKDRSAILHFMATQYANADLTIDAMATAIGVSRTKINDILKSELGFTFTGYLNKLRLTEATRLLAQEEDANIAEIAYSVGYKNVSYFNKLFKEEYSCTPKTYKSLCNKTPDNNR